MLQSEAPAATGLIETLNRTERYVLMLYYAEELTITEISLVLDLPEHRVAETLDVLKGRTRELLAA